MAVRVYLTGRVALEVDGTVALHERQFRGKQGRLAFVYLVCERARTVSREELAAVLWPQESPPAWDSALSALMSRIRGLLSSEMTRCRGVSLSRGFGQYQVLLPADTWIDLEAGASAIDEAEGRLRAGDPGGILGPATVAAAIAERPFLSGVEGEWVDSKRRKLDRQLLRALECLSHMWLANREPAHAVELATRAVALDPFRESSHQLLMRALVASGNRAEAVRAYQRLRNLLSGELGTDPSPETEAVYMEVLR